VVGEKGRVATTLNHLAEEMLLVEIFGVDQVEHFQDPNTTDIRYVLVKNKSAVCDISFDDLTPIEDRVTAIRVAMRMQQHGNDSEIQGGSTP
jgi:hypothetical protein